MKDNEDEFVFGKWDESYIWCPSQLSVDITYQGITYKLYLRWRHDDPWEASLVENWIEDYKQNNDAEIWHVLDISFWRDEEYIAAKRQAVALAKRKIKELQQEP